MAKATAIELSEVENFLFGAGLGPRVGREFARIRDPVMNRLTRELSLAWFPNYFYQIWEIAGGKLRCHTELTYLESVWLRWFEVKLRRLNAKSRDMNIDQFLHSQEGVRIAA
jgi:hypothetical protein